MEGGPFLLRLVTAILISFINVLFLGLLFVLNRHDVFANPLVACAAMAAASGTVIAGINALRGSLP